MDDETRYCMILCTVKYWPGEVCNQKKKQWKYNVMRTILFILWRVYRCRSQICEWESPKTDWWFPKKKIFSFGMRALSIKKTYYGSVCTYCSLLQRKFTECGNTIRQIGHHFRNIQQQLRRRRMTTGPKKEWSGPNRNATAGGCG